MCVQYLRRKLANFKSTELFLVKTLLRCICLYLSMKRLNQLKTVSNTNFYLNHKVGVNGFIARHFTDEENQYVRINAAFLDITLEIGQWKPIVESKNLL